MKRIYHHQQLNQINNHVENLGVVWQDENFKSFAEEVLSGSKQLVYDFEACAEQIKEHIMQNQKSIDHNQNA